MKNKRPEILKTAIFLDSGDPEETRQALDLLGFLDGQTTNPSLIAKTPEVAERLIRGERLSEEEAWETYKKIAQQISGLIPQGSVSLEVYAEESTSTATLLQQAETMNNWIPNAHIKFPVTEAGLGAAGEAVARGMRVNMTLCFTQEQAAAVYAATRGALPGQVYVSPFIGRLDDSGVNGTDLVANIIKMYQSQKEQHVSVLAASTGRSLDHHLRALQLRADIVTSPLHILEEWTEAGMLLPADEYAYERPDLEDIPYVDLDLTKDWREFNTEHPLTTKGLKAFTSDWRSIIQ